jgi:ferredoxin
MTGTRQTIQYSLALEPGDQGETPVNGYQGAEPVVAKPAPESPALTEQLMEELCDRENLVRAWKRVRQNKGSPGVDGMTIGDARDYLREHWPSIRSQLLEGTYQPQPVKRVEIPKPDGGVRKLGVPCVVDRLIQQALLQVLQKRWDPTFSKHSYGFRPGRSAHQAVAQAQRYVAAGYNVVVDPDLEKFFDRSIMTGARRGTSDRQTCAQTHSGAGSGVARDCLHTENFGSGPSKTPGVAAVLRRPPHPPAEAAEAGPLVSFTRSNLAVHWGSAFHSLLELAEACDVPVRWSCRTGVCHNCETGLISGSVTYRPDPVEPPADDNLLICYSQPQGDIALDL